jgi:DNA-binding protein HU-beta
MHKNDFIKAVSRETGVSQGEVARILNSSLDLITRTLANNEKVVLTGFGTFEIRHRSERRGVNPQTGKSIVINATSTPGFTASHSLKAAATGNASKARAMRG